MPRGKACCKQIPAYLAFNFLYRKFDWFSNVLCRIVGFDRIGRWEEILARYPGCNRQSNNLRITREVCGLPFFMSGSALRISDGIYTIQYNKINKIQTYS